MKRVGATIRSSIVGGRTHSSSISSSFAVGNFVEGTWEEVDGCRRTEGAKDEDGGSERTEGVTLVILSRGTGGSDERCVLPFRTEEVSPSRLEDSLVAFFLSEARRGKDSGRASGSAVMRTGSSLLLFRVGMVGSVRLWMVSGALSFDLIPFSFSPAFSLSFCPLFLLPNPKSMLPPTALAA